MRSSIYPALGQYFRTVQEVADAACCSRTRATDCLKGRKDFTPQEKEAIWNAILVRHYKLKTLYRNGEETSDLDTAFRI